MLIETVEQLSTEVEEIATLLRALRPRVAAIYVLLDAALHTAHPPQCPKCGSPMVVRHQKKNPESRFLGCTAYRHGVKSSCKGSMSLDDWRKAAEAALRASTLTPTEEPA